MPVFPFYKFSPSGNTTLFLLDNINANSGAYCRLALESEGICAEQCGTVELSSHTLRMGAGEFCANASRAFGALLALQSQSLSDGKAVNYDVNVSGSPDPVRLQVKGKAPLWEVAATFSIRDAYIEKIDTDAILVRLPGISHILLSDAWPEISKISALAKKARMAYLPYDCPASGIVWWRNENAILSILPHVEVPASSTSMLENSCGSASLALALSLTLINNKKKFLVQQPQGDILAITLEDDNKATVAGKVRLCAKGELFLPSL